MDVKNKVIAVTGAGNGLGRELTLNLIEKGARVIAADINDDALHETVRLAGKKWTSIITVKTDVTDLQSVESLFEKSLDLCESVDGIINNAGILHPFAKLNDLDFAAIERVMNVNFYGMLNMTKVFMPHLAERPEGYIMNISSMGGFLPVAGQTMYGASKAAVKIVTEGLMTELSETNIHVTAVFPGAIRTDIKLHSGLGSEAGVNASDPGTEGMALSPVKAAEIIVDGMLHNKQRIYIGKDAKTMNLLYRINPAKATDMIYKKIRHKI